MGDTRNHPSAQVSARSSGRTQITLLDLITPGLCFGDSHPGCHSALVLHSAAQRLLLLRRLPSHLPEAVPGHGAPSAMADLRAGDENESEDREVPQLTGLSQQELLINCPCSTSFSYFSC